MGLDDAEFTEAREAEERSADEQAGRRAPSVVVAMVTADAGDWFEEVLVGLREQAYPNLSVLVLDAGSERPAQARVEAILPHAHTHVVPGEPGFAAAANAVRELVAGAAFYLVCHDDVHLAPDTVRQLVDEAFRSDAGVVGPKLVAWDDPGSLLQVGQSADKTGVPAPLVERGELDQEQHDAVRDVFVIPGGCTLVRAELFEALEGFDPAMTFLGEDLDLCWRAQIAGARVVVAPAAVVRHREALPVRRPVDDRRRLAARHRLRSVLTCYGPVHLVRVLPWVAVLTVVEAAYALVTGRVGQAGDVLGAWTWNLRRLPELRRRRRLVRATRALPDGEVRRLQVRGSARLTSYVRGELGSAAPVRTLAGRGRELTGSVAAPAGRIDLAVWAALLLVLVVGSRGLLGEPLPAIGSFGRLGGPLELLRAWASGYRDAGLGAVGPSPTAFGLLGLAGIVLLGQEGLLQSLLVLGTVPVGLVGIWRLSRPIGAHWVRVVAVVVYGTVPVPYHAVARGSWGTLALYATAPWILGSLLRAGGHEPSAAGDRGATLRRTLGLGVLLAVLAALVPLIVLLVLVVAVALAAGSLLTGSTEGSRAVLVVAAGASLVAFVLHLPWSVELLTGGGTWRALGGVEPLLDDRVPVTQLLRFGSGAPGTSALRWATVLAAALPLVIGRGWRWTAAVRLWTVALACWGLAFLAGTGLPLPPPSLLLVPAAVALALAAALGVASLGTDLVGDRAPLRRAVAMGLGAAVLVGLLPTVTGAVDGRWGAPEADFASTLSFTGAPDVVAAGEHRVLWLGHPADVPVGSQALDDGLAYGVAGDGPPVLRERWAPAASDADALAADAVRLAAAGRTDRLGRLLAPLGIRYVVLPASAAPEREELPLHERRPGLVATADRQLDLRPIQVDRALAVYENTAWAPVRFAVPAAEVAGLTGAGPLVPAALRLDVAGADAVLPEQRHLRYGGAVDAGTVYVAEAFGDRWQLEVDGERARHVEALGWASAFEVDAPGSATLRYRASPWHRLLIVGQAGLWLGAAALVVHTRRRARP